MVKDKSILQALNIIKSIIEFTDLEIVDYWDADLCAIGIKKGDKLIYISTFNNCNENIIKYDFDLEIVESIEIDSTLILRSFRNESLESLIKELKLFLKV